MKNSSSFDNSPESEWKDCIRPHYIETGKPAHPGPCVRKKVSDKVPEGVRDVPQG